MDPMEVKECRRIRGRRNHSVAPVGAARIETDVPPYKRANFPNCGYAAIG
jgi:hypothetical protein